MLHGTWVLHNASHLHAAIEPPICMCLLIPRWKAVACRLQSPFQGTAWPLLLHDAPVLLLFLHKRRGSSFPWSLQKKKEKKRKRNKKSAVYLPGFIQPPAKVLTAVAPSRLTKKIINRASKNGGGGGHFLSAANRYCALTCQRSKPSTWVFLWVVHQGVRSVGVYTWS